MKKKGHSKYPEDLVRTVLAECHKSSIASVARRYGIPYPTVMGWVHGFNRQDVK